MDGMSGARDWACLVETTLWNIESYTSEKVGIVAGPEFEGHTLIIIRALYGLRSSGHCWHDRFANVLKTMGFKQCLTDNDVWMRNKGDHYEYIGVYVDDLQIASRAPDDIIKSLQVEIGRASCRER